MCFKGSLNILAISINFVLPRALGLKITLKLLSFIVATVNIFMYLLCERDLGATCYHFTCL